MMRSAAYFLSLGLALGATWPVAIAQTSKQTNLEAFLRQSDARTLNSGRAFYVERPTSSIPDELRYTTVDLIPGVALTPQGEKVTILGRYDREGGRIEVSYLRSLVVLESKYFPYVRLGEESLGTVEFAQGNTLVERYAVLRAGSSDLAYRLYTLYEVSPSSNPPIERGIARPARGSGVRLDSLTLLTGLRAQATRLPRRERQFIRELDGCEEEALAGLPGAYSRDDLHYLSGLVDALNAACPTN